MFVNTVAVPFNLSPDMSFAQLVDAAAHEVDFVMRHSQLPMAEIVKYLDLSKHLRGEPPFNVAFSFHDSIPLAPHFSGLEVTVEEGLANGSAKFDLNVIGILANHTASRPFELVWEYNTDLFDGPTVERLVDHYLTLLQALVSDPSAELSSALPFVHESPLVDNIQSDRKAVHAEMSRATEPSDRVGAVFLPEASSLSQGHRLKAVLSILDELMPGASLQPDDDLFDKGLHSMLMMRFAARCKAELDAEIKVSEIYRLATARLIAGALSSSISRTTRG